MEDRDAFVFRVHSPRDFRPIPWTKVFGRETENVGTPLHPSPGPLSLSQLFASLCHAGSMHDDAQGPSSSALSLTRPWLHVETRLCHPQVQDLFFEPYEAAEIRLAMQEGYDGVDEYHYEAARGQVQPTPLSGPFKARRIPPSLRGHPNGRGAPPLTLGLQVFLGHTKDGRREVTNHDEEAEKARVKKAGGVGENSCVSGGACIEGR